MQTRDAIDVSTHARRQSTEAFHREIVERAVLAIQSRYAEENLGLSAMADAAISSPFHFARLFRQISGVPPGHFLTAVRMQEAKRLLEETRLSVINVCLDVGYSSIGTFTRRFTELVGLPPLHYRRLAQMPRVPAPRPEDMPDAPAHPPVRPRDDSGATLAGQVCGPGLNVPVVIGLFSSALPQGRPIACAMTFAPGPYRIDGVPPGRYFVLAAGLTADGALSREPDLRASLDGALRIDAHDREIRCDLHLRHRRLTDPPIVICVPYLFAEAMGYAAGRRMRAHGDDAAGDDEIADLGRDAAQAGIGIGAGSGSGIDTGIGTDTGAGTGTCTLAHAGDADDKRA